MTWRIALGATFLAALLADAEAETAADAQRARDVARGFRERAEAARRAE